LDIDAETLPVLDWELDAVTDAVMLPLLLAVMLGDWELVPAEGFGVQAIGSRVQRAKWGHRDA
jgi:hypothetical protein